MRNGDVRFQNHRFREQDLPREQSNQLVGKGCSIKERFRDVGTLFSANQDQADIVAKKRTMLLKRNAGQCRSCDFFVWTPVGELNRCVLGGFSCSSQHGCAFFRAGNPLYAKSKREFEH